MTGFEPLIAQAVSGVAVPVFQSIWAGGGKILDRFGKALDAKKAKQAIDAASRQYAQNYTKRHGILKVLGMRESVPLESVYTAIQFLDNESLRNFESVETLEEGRTQVRAYCSPVIPCSGSTVLLHQPFCTIQTSLPKICSTGGSG